jgi:hypothetical protein
MKRRTFLHAAFGALLAGCTQINNKKESYLQISEELKLKEEFKSLQNYLDAYYRETSITSQNAYTLKLAATLEQNIRSYDEKELGKKGFADRIILSRLCEQLKNDFELSKQPYSLSSTEVKEISERLKVNSNTLLQVLYMPQRKNGF